MKTCFVYKLKVLAYLSKLLLSKNIRDYSGRQWLFELETLSKIYIRARISWVSVSSRLPTTVGNRDGKYDEIILREILLIYLCVVFSYKLVGNSKCPLLILRLYFTTFICAMGLCCTGDCGK